MGLLGSGVWRGLVLVGVASGAVCGAEERVVAAGTPLTVRVEEHLPLVVGTPLRAHLMYPVYAGETLLLPAETVVTGSVVGFEVSRSKRIRARLNGDFTPFHTPVVRFTGLVLGDGRAVPMEAKTVTDGAPVYRLVAPPPHKGGFVRQEIEAGKQIVRDDLAVFTGPEKKDRAVQFLYGQLPYHPQRIETGTAWTVETSAAVTVPGGEEAVAVVPPPVPPGSAKAVGLEAAAAADTWVLQASLAAGLDSGTARSGQEVRAVVAEPVFREDRTVAVPQGAVLLGAVTQVKPARRFGRAGVLRFDFREIQMPGEAPQNVTASLTGADSAGGNLSLTSEGEVKQKPQDKLSVPIFLALLASRPLDQDHQGALRQGVKNGAGSNGLGLVGRVVGVAAGSPYFAAGLGYYEAALTFYDRWIAKGKQVTFARDTRIVVQTTPRRGEMLSLSK